MAATAGLSLPATVEVLYGSDLGLAVLWEAEFEAGENATATCLVWQDAQDALVPDLA